MCFACSPLSHSPVSSWVQAGDRVEVRVWPWTTCPRTWLSWIFSSPFSCPSCESAQRLLAVESGLIYLKVSKPLIMGTHTNSCSTSTLYPLTLFLILTTWQHSGLPLFQFKSWKLPSITLQSLRADLLCSSHSMYSRPSVFFRGLVPGLLWTQNPLMLKILI